MQKVIVDYLVKVTTDTAKGKGSWSSMAAEATKAGVAVSTVAAGFAAAGAAAVALANDITGTIDRLDTFAANSGLAVETVAGLDAIAKASGKQLQQLVPKDLPKRIADTARGTGEAKEGFASLGISVRDASGKLKTSDQILRESLDGLSQIEDSTIRAAVAQQIFGSEAQELAGAIAGGAGALDAWVGYAGKYTDVGADAQRITAEWQQATALFSMGVEKLKYDMLPLVDMMSNVVRGFAAMAAGAKGAAKGIFDPPGGLVGAIVGGYNEIKGFAVEVNTLNKRLKETADAAAEAAKETAKFTDPEAMKALAKSNEEAAKKALADLERRKKKAAEEAARRRKEAEKAAAAEEMRRLGLAFLEAGPNAGITTLKLTSDIGDKLAEQLAELDDIMGEAVKGMIDAAEKEKAAAEADRAAAEEASRVNKEDQLAAASDPIGFAMAGAAAANPMLAAMAQGLVGLPAQMEALTAAVIDLPKALYDLPELVTGLSDALADLPSALIDASPEIARGLMNLVVESFLIGAELFFQTVAVIFDALPGKIAEAVAEALRGLVSNLNPFDGDGNFLFGMADKALDALPFFDTGGDVTRTGLAVVHEGERVLTQAEREALMTGMSRPTTINVVNPDPAAAARAVSRALGGGQRIRLGV